MSTPQIAVLMSLFGDARFLAAQLDSLAAQEGVDCHLYVRDDGATDGARAVLASYAWRWPQLSDVVAGRNLGAALSFLELLRLAPAGFDYYAFCDQDDVWLPDKLARAAERLSEFTRAGPALYCSQVTCVDANLRELGELIPHSCEPTFEHMLFENVAVGMTVVMNAKARELIVARLPVTGLIMHDWWCALAVAALGTLIFDRQPHVLYRQHGSNAIGGQANRLAAALAKFRVFLRDPPTFNPIHAQAVAFREAFGSELRPADRCVLERLITSKRSLGARLSLVLFGGVPRSRWPEGLMLRGLISMGWY